MRGKLIKNGNIITECAQNLNFFQMQILLLNIENTLNCSK